VSPHASVQTPKFFGSEKVALIHSLFPPLKNIIPRCQLVYFLFFIETKQFQFLNLYLLLCHLFRIEKPVKKICFYSELKAQYCIYISTFLAQLEAAGQVGPAHGSSQMNGKRSLAQDVCAIALELSALLEALKARQRSCDEFVEGFKKDLIRVGSISAEFWVHQEYIPCNSHLSPSFEAEVMKVDNLKSGW
jgi:hypothetical protein